MKTLPSREEIGGQIRSLLSGELSREEVSSWAVRFIVDDDYMPFDQTSWEVIKALGGADLISTDRPYLYGHSDFEEWLRMLG